MTKDDYPGEERRGITFDEAAVALNPNEDEENGVAVQIYDEDRPKWGNKIEFILATIGFAVGLGNVWRFPYLCQKNGGGAFLIPYTISLALIGIPLFFLELGIGQSVRQGSIGVWNYIHPYLGGVGYASVIVCLLVGMYYNMIIAWCFYYLFASWQTPLPYEHCPKVDTGNGSLIDLPACEMAGRTQYYWYKEAITVSRSIEESGGIAWHLALSLLLAWVVVWLCLMRGIQSAGKAVYFTATFPYVVLIIFFFRGVTLDGCWDGIKHMFYPQWEMLASPQVWLEAATQIFFSLSLAFGGLIAMSSYNPVNNNCHRDAIMVSIINCGTSVFAGIVIFSILGFKAHTQMTDCHKMYGPNGTFSLGNFTLDEKCHNMTYWLSESGSGPGLTFIAFTEAILQIPVSPLWATLFFCMLLTLGLGSMFGTLEGVITPVYDMKIVPWRKEFVTAAICAFSYLIGLLFCQRSGEYWLQMFDTYAGTIPLLIIGLFELVGVAWIYGIKRFEDDLEYMLKMRPSKYFTICWKYVSPILVILLLGASLINMGLQPIKYSTWNFAKAVEEKLDYPPWGYAMIALLICSSFLFIPGIFLLRRFRIIKYEGKDYGKASGQEDIAPGAITPSLSRIPLPPSEIPLAGRASNSEIIA
ncbi:sodium-dependent neutral amino acid transporter B(0)AT2 isoform X2 [Nematostella vectensis]|uniref:sodium-dependent neutral amino acid transporter B(0)AT2 isoform X2 n=1 Tax=Nematostella vectensis TaxID=45351 RepID=UPI00138FFB3A|nr:sodium-dependent neutral amino acid transporter B(0)AT2 isoform X2 [Nematostella vectensis]XP_048580549.1 sodium-dependent neutral amino acid transporter B(0)AT2 isoform X2 [Nematostella vectensis]